MVDARPLTRKSVADMFTRGLPDHVVVAVSSCQELLNLPEKSQPKPGMILLNASPGSAGGEWVRDAVQWLQKWLPNTPVIVLSDDNDGGEIDELLSLGVRGYLPTTVDPEVAFAAVRLVGAGGTYVPVPFIRQMVVRREAASLSVRNPGATELPAGLDLTPREMAVAELVRRGKPNKVIGAELSLEESTVKVHVRNIMKKLGAANRTQVALVVNRLFVRAIEAETSPPANNHIVTRSVTIDEFEAVASRSAARRES